MITHGGASYRILRPSGVLTYPAFRGEGWMRSLLERAGRLIDEADCDAGLLFCRPSMIDFYSRSGWEPVPGASIVAGPDDATWEVTDAVLIRPVNAHGEGLR